MDSATSFVAVYDTKPYDREYLSAAARIGGLHLRFHEFRLEASTVFSTEGAKSVCVFVNDDMRRSTLEALVRHGVRMVALRCAGFNNVDIEAAKELEIAVSRVPSYSPHAVAEHTIALILTLNRKTHRAFNRVRELNFSLNGLVGFDLHGKTAGLIGTGKIGRIAAQILRGFGMRVLAFDPFPNSEWALQNGVDYCRHGDDLQAKRHRFAARASYSRDRSHHRDRLHRDDETRCHGGQCQPRTPGAHESAD